MVSHSICPVSGSFHFVSCIPGSSVCSHRTELPSFQGWIIFHRIYHIFFIHSSVHGHLSCLHVLPIVLETYIYISFHPQTPTGHRTWWTSTGFPCTISNLALTGEAWQRGNHVTQAWPQWLALGWAHGQAEPIRIILVCFGFFFFFAKTIGRASLLPLDLLT